VSIVANHLLGIPARAADNAGDAGTAVVAVDAVTAVITYTSGIRDTLCANVVQGVVKRHTALRNAPRYENLRGSL
jgi:hypothetical protein